MKTYFFILILLIGASCTDKEPVSTTQQASPKGRQLNYERTVQFLQLDGQVVTEIQVAVVDTEQERNMGLMDVYDMPMDRGMLFIFDRMAPLSFWMANTPLSLDILFLDADKRIVTIHANTPPFSEQNFESTGMAMYAVEVNAGFCLQHDIRVGMKVAF